MLVSKTVAAQVTKSTVGTRLLPLLFALGLVSATCVLAQPATNAPETPPTPASATNTPSLEEPEQGATNPSAANATPSGHHSMHGNGNAIFGQNVEIKPGETVNDVVLIGGSARIRGKAQGDVVVIGGDIDVDGTVLGDTVAIMGMVRIHTNADVHGDAVAVLGGVQVQTNASVGGDVVGVGGDTEVADGAKVHGDVVPLNFGFGKIGLPRGIRLWFTECVLKLRPLAPQVGWVWMVAGVFFLLYLLVAAAFPHPVQVCVEELTRRPASTFLFGLLTKMLLPLVMLILAVTAVGLIVVPFLWAAIFLGAIVGKVALLEWLGLKLGRQSGAPALQKPLIAFLIGTLVLTLLYLVPVLGLLTFLIVSVWGLGCAVTAAFGRLRRETPPKPVFPVPAPGGPPPGQPAPAAAATGPSLTEGQPSLGAQGQTEASTATATLTMPATSAPAAIPDVYSYPRAGFWVRLGAGFLDLLLVMMLTALAHGLAPGLRLDGPFLAMVVSVAYFSGMWTWRGTTIGGIVLGLKVARLDGQPVSFVIALVRALAGVFSFMVLFLGFFWIAWNQEKQGWHDLIAGTVVLRMPRATPLICA